MAKLRVSGLSLMGAPQWEICLSADLLSYPTGLCCLHAAVNGTGFFHGLSACVVCCCGWSAVRGGMRMK